MMKKRTEARWMVSTEHVKYPFHTELEKCPRPSISDQRMPKNVKGVGGRYALQGGMKINTTKSTKKKFSLSTVIVVGAGFRCLAFRDAQGKLRNFWNQNILPLPVHILDPEN